MRDEPGMKPAIDGIDTRYIDGGYLSDHPDWHAERGPWKAAHIVQGLHDAGVNPPSSVCDIGCGTGRVVAQVAAALGCRRAVGFEPSPNAPVHANALGKVEIRRTSAVTCTESFDVALMMDVFEHVPDYLGLLSSVRHLASTFVFHVPLEISALTVLSGKVGSTRVSLGHLHQFTRRTALDALSDAGYTAVHWHYTKSGWDGPGKRPWVPSNVVRRSVARVGGLTAAERLVGGLSLLVVAVTE